MFSSKHLTLDVKIYPKSALYHVDNASLHNELLTVFFGNVSFCEFYSSYFAKKFLERVST